MVMAAARAPELYYAYIGLGQMTYQLQSEQLAYAYALAHYQQTGNVKMLGKLKAAPPTMSMPLPPAYDALRDDYMHAAGIGTTRDITSVITGGFVPSWFSREFTLREKINLWRGKFYRVSLALVVDPDRVVTELVERVIPRV